MNGPLQTGNQKFDVTQLLKYLKLDSGRLHNPPRIRFISMGLQVGLLFYFSINAWLWRWMLNTSGFFFLVFLLWEIVCWFGYIYFSLAVYLSVRDNLPKMVTTKNTIGLFVFTIVFFETVVMALLFWLLYGVLSWVNAPMCHSQFCTGLITGIFLFVNEIALICVVVTLRARRSLGIGFLDAFNF